MKNEELNVKYTVCDFDELPFEDRELIMRASQACSHSYSPYSGFKVGCAVRLSDNSIVIGANQENAAYPSGLCAERTALFSAAMYDKDIVYLAISAEDENSNPATAYPCGACRQVMSEVKVKQKTNNIRVLISREDKSVLCLKDVNDLMPFSFDFHK